MKMKWNFFVVIILLCKQFPSVFAATPEQLSAAAKSASQWLAAKQLPDGSWNDDESLKALCTTEAVISLRAFNQFQNVYYQGITWLENHGVNNTDYQSRRILALVPHGNTVVQEINALTESITAIDSTKNGWGISQHYHPSSVDTAFGLLAFDAVKNNADISKSMAFLKSVQLQNGQDKGWALSEEAVSHLSITAQILLSLNQYKDKNFNLALALQNAANTLLQQVNANSPDIVKGEAVLALIRYQGVTPPVDALLDSILQKQQNDGSWNQDVYATAVNLRAIASALGTDQEDYLTPILIPDLQLRAAINANLNKNAADAITKGELASLINLDLSNSGIKDLAGLEYAINLETLNLCGNPIKSLAPLKNLPPKLANVTYCQDHDLAPDADTDQDGMPDAWEILYGFDPLDPADANDDPDNDGLSNLEEFQLGTDPLVPNLLDELYGLHFVKANADNMRMYDAVVSPDGRHLYAVSYYSNALLVYRRNVTTGELEKIQTINDDQNGVNGLQKAMAVSMSPNGRHVYVASPEDHSIAYFTRDANDGKLTFVQQWVEGANDGTGKIIDGLQGATNAKVSKNGQYVLVTAGVDHSLALFKRNLYSGWLAFVGVVHNGGLDANNEIVSGIQHATDVVITDDNKHVYVTGFQNNAIAVFALDPNTQQLLFQQVIQDNGVDDANQVVTDLLGPIALEMSHDNKHLYVTNLNANSLLVFSRDPNTGKLTLIQTLKNGADDGAGHIITGLTAPSSVAISVDDQFFYVTGQQDHAIEVFKRDSNSGKLIFVQSLQHGKPDKKNNIVTNMQFAQSVTVSPNNLHVYVASYDLAMVTFERETQYLDSDKDGDVNKIDLDDDNDGVNDPQDEFPFDPLESADADKDFIGDNADAFPNDPNVWFDTDKDGLSNHADSDDDNDTLPDVWELTTGLNLMQANDAALDIDTDVLNNLGEYAAITNPSLWDTDGDAMPDGWEVQYGLDPLVPNGNEDPDGDNWTNVVEYQKGTDPLDPDTDNDGIIDSEDLFPLDPNEAQDNDKDGVGDNMDPDDDNDGMPDVWENQYGFNPLDPSDADIDTDGDGYTNLEEYLAGTDPTDPNSFPSELMNDFDADGKSDVLWYNPATGKTHLWLMDGPVIKNQQVLNIPASWRIGGVADFNGDKKADIVWRDENIHEFTLWIMDVFIKIQEKPLTKPSAQILIGGVGDVNGDAKADIIWHDQAGGVVTVSLMDGVTVKDQQQIANNVNPNWKVGSVSGFNKDNKADIRWDEMLNANTVYKNHIWEMNGFNYAQKLKVATYSSNEKTRAIIANDFDSDGDGDFFSLTEALPQNNLPSYVRLWLTQNYQTQKIVNVPSQANLWQIIATGDFDDDGHLDLLWHYGNTDLFKVWGMQSFVASVAWLPAQDSDNDGMPDVWEAINNFNPFDPNDANLDLDADGLTNLNEFLHDTYPNDATTDNDKIPDNWEVIHGLNPLYDGDENLDPDNDGFTNLEEFYWDTDPQDPNSYPKPNAYQDFNADGISDIVWRNRDTGDVEIWLMDQFTILQKQAIGAFSLNWLLVGIADVDGDKKPDFLWHDQAAGKLILTTMDGLVVKDQQPIMDNFSVTTTIAGVGDVDADGRADVLLYDFSAKSAKLLLLDGFAIKQQQIIANNLLATWAPGGMGDVNHDGKADIYWIDYTKASPNNYSDLYIWLMDAVTITNQKKVQSLAYPDEFAAVGDGNGDGNMDAITERTNTASIYHFDGVIKLGQKNISNPNIFQHVHVGIFDKNTKYDLVTYDKLGQAKIYLMDQTHKNIGAAMGANWQIQPLIRNQYDSDKDGMDDLWEIKHGLNPYDAVDANADNDNDLLDNLMEYQAKTNPLNIDTDADELPDGWEVAYGLDPLSSIGKQADADGDGFSNFEEYFYSTDPTDPNSFPQISPYHDFDGNGDSDILWFNPTTHEAMIWFMDGLNANQQSIGVFAASWLPQGMGDFDGDGKADILWRDSNNGQAYISLMDGKTIKNQGQITSLALNWQVKGIGDFDADGKADILWHDQAAGAAKIHFMNGLNTLQQQQIAKNINNTWQVAAVGDLDADGKADIRWNTPTFYHLWLMDGISIKQAKENVGFNLASETTIALADVDGDKKADMITQSLNVNSSGGTLMDGVITKTFFTISSFDIGKMKTVGRFDHNSRFDFVYYNIDTGLTTLVYLEGDNLFTTVKNVIGNPMLNPWEIVK